jgi:hypothetical protein
VPGRLWCSISCCARSSRENELCTGRQRGITLRVRWLQMLSVFGSLPRVPPQKCRFERPLAERRKTGTDLVRPLDTFRCRRLRHLSLLGASFFQPPHPTRTALRQRRQHMTGNIGTDPVSVPAVAFVEAADRRVLSRMIGLFSCTHNWISFLNSASSNNMVSVGQEGRLHRRFCRCAALERMGAEGYRRCTRSRRRQGRVLTRKHCG